MHPDARRGGLSARPGGQQQDQVAIHVGKFDFDAEVDGLRGHVKKIKQVCTLSRVKDRWSIRLCPARLRP